VFPTHDRLDKHFRRFCMRNCLALLMLLFPLTSFGEDTMRNNANEITKHYLAQPNLYQLDNISKEKLSNKITRQYIMGSQSMLVKWTLQKEAVIPLHFHPNEQVTWITKGSVKVFSQGKEFLVKAGGVIIIPPNVPHEFLALEDTIDIDFFTPVREDWLNNTASYIQTIQKKIS
jgi:quercetin dioxygenase-like cupin family protein